MGPMDLNSHVRLCFQIVVLSIETGCNVPKSFIPTHKHHSLLYRHFIKPLKACNGKSSY